MTTIRDLERKIAQVKRMTKDVNRNLLIRQLAMQDQIDPADLNVNDVIEQLSTSVQTLDIANARDLLSQVSAWLDYAENTLNSGGVQGAVRSLPSIKALRTSDVHIGNPLYPELNQRAQRKQSPRQYDPLYPERG